MKHSGKQLRPSRTAQWVAAARSVGTLLPAELVLAADPYGVAFAHGGVRRVSDLLLSHPRLSRRLLSRAGPLTSFLLWMQLRTHALDEILLAFARGGGRQIVLLGAGYDSRALRFGRELRAATVFEVDQPATQQEKVRLIPAETVDTRLVYLGWDFEREALADLPAALHRHGLDAGAPVLTIWEGVTMYLSPPAIEEAVHAVRAFGSVGSQLAFTYIDRRALEQPRREVKWSAALVASVGEPWRFGWRPAELPAWLAARGLSLLSDASDGELAERYLPQRTWRRFTRRARRIAVAEVRARPELHTP